MEARAEYEPWRERPRLTVVKDGGATYSALPHELLTDPRSKHGHIVTYAVLQMHWWQGGECWQSHAKLAVEAKCSERQLQRYLKDLVRWEYVKERFRGQGQAKAYAPVQHDTGVRSNLTPVSASDANTTPVSEQHDTGVVLNTTPVSDKGRRNEEDSLKEEDTGESVAADAAPKPARAKAAGGIKGKPMTPCPETFPLDEKHFEYAQSLGLDRKRALAETDKFLAHHRFKGTKGQDWYAGWQNWMRRAVQYDAQPRSGQPQRNGTAAHAAQPTRLPAKNVRTY